MSSLVQASRAKAAEGGLDSEAAVDTESAGQKAQPLEEKGVAVLAEAVAQQETAVPEGENKTKPDALQEPALETADSEALDAKPLSQV